MKYEPEESRQSSVTWESLAVEFLKYCNADKHQESSLNSVAGALSALSQAALGKIQSPSKKSAGALSARRADSSHGRSQTSLADGEDTQPTEDIPSDSSSPPTPPLQLRDAFDITNPEYRTLLSQLRALVCPCLVHLYPKSELAASKFLVDGTASNPSWYVRALPAEEDSGARAKSIPPFPQQLTNELLNVIRSQLVKRTSSAANFSAASFSPVHSPTRLPGALEEAQRTKTLSSLKHAPLNGPLDLEDAHQSPNKRIKMADGMAGPAASVPRVLLSPEAANLRILQLEAAQESLWRELVSLKAEIEQLKKPQNTASS